MTVHYATTDGTAAQPGDYAETSGTLTFTPGQTTKTVTVPVADDALDEPAETFSLDLDSPTGATIAGDGSALATVADDDLPPGISVGDATVTEGATGSVPAEFTISLTGPSAKPVSVAYSTSDVSAAQPGDYSPTSGTLTFSPGQTTKKITVAVNGDSLDEDDEAFHVDLSNAVNTTLIGGHGTGTIVDDDPSVSAAIDDVTVTEGNLGQTAATFTVSLSGASGRAITVVYTTADGTARAPGDYGSGTGTLVIPAGQTSGKVTVAVNGDTTDEGDETFTLTLSGPSGVTLADASGTATIRDDDAPDHSAPVLSALRLGPSAFRSAPSGKSGIINPKPRTSGSTVSFTLNEQATVTFRVAHVLKSRGRLSGGKCRTRTRANARRKKCDLQRQVSGTIRPAAKAGANSFGFSGWVGGKRLGRGSYRLVATTTDAAGNTSTGVGANFTIR